MAERRMFAKSIIGSARFLRMPPTSRLLYYDLGMAADDDGVVEAFSVMRTTGSNEDDLKVLASKGFVRVLNEDLVTYITDWGRNNYIQKDRYHPSVYQKLLVEIQVDTECIQDVPGMDTQVRVGEGREVEYSRDETIKTDKSPVRFSPPSIEDVEKYCIEKGYHIDAEAFVAFYEAKGWYIGKNKMKSWKSALVTWEKRNGGVLHGNDRSESRAGEDRNWTAGFHESEL